MTLQQLKYAVKIADCKSASKAAAQLFITQPALSVAIRELEDEIGTAIFERSNHGMKVTPEGEEFLEHARMMTQEYVFIEKHFIEHKNVKKKFSVAMQHYTFAVQAFMDTIKKYGLDEYEFAIYETKTAEVIERVGNARCELGLIYTDDFNRKPIERILKEHSLEFKKLFDCSVYVYLSKDHPLADKKSITLDELQEYPCLSFDQGAPNAFYFAEEVFSTFGYKRLIHASDRATLLNLMVGMNAYTLCSGIICNELNGNCYTAVPLAAQNKMTIGYIKRKKAALSRIGEEYITTLLKYQKNVL